MRSMKRRRGFREGPWTSFSLLRFALTIGDTSRDGEVALGRVACRDGFRDRSPKLTSAFVPEQLLPETSGFAPGVSILR